MLPKLFSNELGSIMDSSIFFMNEKMRKIGRKEKGKDKRG